MTAKKTTTLFILAALALGLPQCHAQEDGKAAAAPFADTYWEMSYPAPQATVFHTLVLQVKNLDKAEQEIEKLMKKYKPIESLKPPPNTPGRDSRRQLAYLLNLEDAEKASQKLFELGVVKQYNVSRHNMPDRLAEIDGKIAQLTQEISNNKAALAAMPIAKFMLNQKLTQLETAKKSYDESRTRARIQMTLLIEDEAFRQY